MSPTSLSCAALPSSHPVMQRQVLLDILVHRRKSCGKGRWMQSAKIINQASPAESLAGLQCSYKWSLCFPFHGTAKDWHAGNVWYKAGPSFTLLLLMLLLLLLLLLFPLVVTLWSDSSGLHIFFLLHPEKHSSEVPNSPTPLQSALGSCLMTLVDLQHQLILP